MFVAYKNKNDNYEIHIGEVLTSVDNIKSAIYIDIIPDGHLVTHEKDWKNTHIDSIEAKDVLCFADCTESFKEHFPELFV
jgi:hypothetical protein